MTTLTMTRDELEAHIDYVFLGTVRSPQKHRILPERRPPSRVQVLLYEQVKLVLLEKFDADGEVYWNGDRYIKTDHPVPGWGMETPKWSEMQRRIPAARER
jgi:hypothetical protein